MFNPLLPTSYVIESDQEAAITIGPSDSSVRSISYESTYHLVRFNPKANTVGPAFHMPVRMRFEVQ